MLLSKAKDKIYFSALGVVKKIELDRRLQRMALLIQIDVEHPLEKEEKQTII